MQRAFRRRMAVGPIPLVSLAAAWLLGVLCAGGLDAGRWQAAGAIAALAGGTAAALWGLYGRQSPDGRAGERRDAAQSRWAALALILGAFVAGVCVGPRHAPAPLRVPAGMTRLEAVVAHSQAGAADSARSVLRVLHGARLEDGALVPPGVLLSAGPARLPSGARIRAVAKLAPGLPFRNPSPHPATPRRFDVQGRAWIPDPHAVRVLHAPLGAALLDAARAHVRDALEATLPTRTAGVARALVLGEGAAIDPLDQADVRDSGLLHVFAVSGLHVAILAGLAVAALRRALLLCTPLAARFEVRRIACAAGVPLALVYAEFAGSAPSAWRAAVTAALAWTLVALGRRPDPVAAFAMTVVVLGALDPYEATRPAFLLSIAATAAILSGPGAPIGGLREALAAAWTISVRTWLATAPIVLWCFGSVPVAGVVANVVLLPVGTLLLQLAAAHALLSSATPFGALSAQPLVVVVDAFLGACRAFAQLDPGFVWPPPDVPQGMTLALAAILLLLVRGWRAKVAVALLAVLALALFEARLRAREQPEGVLRVTFADVGQGDAALIDLPDGRLMLIDAGGSPGGGLDPGRAALLPLLQARRRARIDVAVLTHPHPDHYGGLHALLEQLPITELWDSGQAAAESDLAPAAGEATRLIAAARARGTRVRTPGELCGRVRSAGGARIQLLWPCPRYESTRDANDNSLVLRIDYGRHGLLFAGDAEQHAEASLLARGVPLRADVLKVAHHGSRTSTSEAFLRAVAPRLALISAGAGNRFGHPHAEVVERLRARVRQVVSLADEGGTVVHSDGRTLRFEAFSGRSFEF
jgi:competence protein ComEC